MKKLVTLLLITMGLLFLTAGCSDDCDGKNPTVQLVNNGTAKADVQIKTSGGNTENINNIMPGTSSESRSFAQGEIEFNITLQGDPKPITHIMEIYNCNEYKVIINEDNTVKGEVTSLNKVGI